MNARDTMEFGTPEQLYERFDFRWLARLDHLATMATEASMRCYNHKPEEERERLILVAQRLRAEVDSMLLEEGEAVIDFLESSYGEQEECDTIRERDNGR